MNSNWLADVFIKQREIIEAAETPFSKLAIFVLPIISPLVPAFVTGVHLYKLFLEMFTFSYADNVSLFMSSIIAVVLELLGYVGALSFIKSLYTWIKEKTQEFIVPVILNLIAYIFYLVIMFSVNVALGRYFNTAPIINWIIGLLAFMTVPTSILAANHLNAKEQYDREEKRYQEKRADRMETKRMQYQSTAPSISKTKTTRMPGDYKTYVFELLDKYGELPLTKITELVNRDKRVQFIHSDAKGTWYKYVQEWKRDHPQ